MNDLKNKLVSQQDVIKCLYLISFGSLFFSSTISICYLVIGTDFKIITPEKVYKLFFLSAPISGLIGAYIGVEGFLSKNKAIDKSFAKKLASIVGFTILLFGLLGASIYGFANN